MQSQRQAWDGFSFVSKVLTVTALLAVSPFVAIACVPLVCFLLPVAFMAIPFLLVAFFGETKDMREPQPLRQLQPQLAGV
jgi:hypothetical protein